MWCGNCGAHFARCSCGVAAREVFTEAPSFEQLEAICARRFPSSKTSRTEMQWQRFVCRYAEDIANDCVKSGAALREIDASIDLAKVAQTHIQGVTVESTAAVLTAYNGMRERNGKPVIPYGIIRTTQGENLCLFVGDEIELVTATGKTATLERKEARRLGRLLMDAATFRKADEI